MASLAATMCTSSGASRSLREASGEASLPERSESDELFAARRDGTSRVFTERVRGAGSASVCSRAAAAAALKASEDETRRRETEALIEARLFSARLADRNSQLSSSRDGEAGDRADGFRTEEGARGEGELAAALKKKTAELERAVALAREEAATSANTAEAAASSEAEQRAKSRDLERRADAAERALEDVRNRLDAAETRVAERVAEETSRRAAEAAAAPRRTPPRAPSRATGSGGFRRRSRAAERETASQSRAAAARGRGRTRWVGARRGRCRASRNDAALMTSRGFAAHRDVERLRSALAIAEAAVARRRFEEHRQRSIGSSRLTQSAAARAAERGPWI